MKHRISFIIALAAAGLLASCKPADPEQAGDTTSIHLTTQQNGLAYAPGSSTPYTGEVTVFTPSHTRQSVESWENGKPHGPWTRYWSNGRAKRQDIHWQGSITHRRQWFEDGTPKLDAEMRNGVGYGKIRLWWPDGRLRRSALLGKDIQPHGHVLEYAEDGTVIADAIFDNGKYVSGKLREEPVAKSDTALAN